MLKAIWKSGWFGKGLLILLPITLFGMYDIYRMVGYFSRFYAAAAEREQWVSEHVIPFTPSGASGLDPEYESRIDGVLRRLRDSLSVVDEFAENGPAGYEPLEVGVRCQLDSTLHGYKLFTYVDFRLQCDCHESGFFRLLRYRIDPGDLSTDIIADEVVEWLKYAPMDRVLDEETNIRGDDLTSNLPTPDQPQTAFEDEGERRGVS